MVDSGAGHTIPGRVIGAVELVDRLAPRLL